MTVTVIVITGAGSGIGAEDAAIPLARPAGPAVGADWVSGAYDERSKVARRVNPQSSDPDLARYGWDRSAQILKLPDS